MAVYDSNYHFRKSMLFQKSMKKQEIFVLLRRRTNEYGKKWSKRNKICTGICAWFCVTSQKGLQGYDFSQAVSGQGKSAESV